MFIQPIHNKDLTKTVFQTRMIQQIINVENELMF